MITLSDVMQLECMVNAKIIAGPQCLHQPIINVAMLDHEPLLKQYDDFFKHEFVLTSLLFGKDNPQLVKEAILELVKREISGIAIKKLFDFELDEETIQQINQSQTTLLVYQGVTMEDIIAPIKNLLYKDQDETKYENWINELLKHESFSESIKMITSNLIPDNWSHVRCHLVEPKSKHDSFYHALQQLRTNVSNKNVKAYKYQRYYLLIEDGTHETGLYENSYTHYSVSELLQRDELQYALKQVVQAMEYSIKHNIEKMNYTDLQSEIFSYAVLDNWLIQHYCKKQMHKIKEHDQNYSTNLMETLNTYISCHGDVKQCGQILYQHPNTVRYRIGKIKELFNLDHLEEKAAYEYLFMLVYLNDSL